MIKNKLNPSANNSISAVVGMSHLGLVTAIGLASLKSSIIGIDSNKLLIQNLTRKKLPLFEPGLQELLEKVNNRINFNDDFSLLKDIPFVFFSQDTATDGSGSVKKLDNLFDKAIPYFAPDVTIVCMSQVPIGYYRNLNKKIKKARPNLPFDLYHMVDTIIMTQAIERFVNPERIIIGSADPLIKFSKSLKKFLKLFSCPTFHMSYESAELTKAAINLYLANSVTFANTLSDYCEVTGANINEIIPALQTDKRIGPFTYLRPTLRIAGGHLGRDLRMLKRLAANKNISPGIVKFIMQQNSNRYKWVLNQLQPALKKIKNPTICIWGLSYKNNTQSTIDAVSTIIIKQLSKKAKIKVYDPMAILPKSLSGYTRFDDKYQALKNADVLLVLTEWDEFSKIDSSRINSINTLKLIIDAVAILKKMEINKIKLQYITMGNS